MAKKTTRTPKRASDTGRLQLALDAAQLGGGNTIQSAAWSLGTSALRKLSMLPPAGYRSRKSWSMYIKIT